MKRGAMPAGVFRHPQDAAPATTSWNERAPARRDLAWVLVGTVLAFVVASVLEMHEHLSALLLRGEAWQVDELPSTLLALALGMTWYARRRGREAVRTLARNRELARALIALQDREQLALARELHDEFAQHCTAIRVEATYILRSDSLDRIGDAARRVAASAQALQDDVRRLVRRLRPSDLDELGLVAALRSLCDGWTRRTGIPCALRVADALPERGAAVDTTLYRVAQEALANVARHANATRVAIALAVTAQDLTLCVEDDGRGFAVAARTTGFGLLGATERGAALGGRLEIDSAPGAGTRLRLRLPLGTATPREGGGIA